MNVAKITTTQVTTPERLAEAEATGDAVASALAAELNARMWTTDVELGITPLQRMIAIAK